MNNLEKLRLRKIAAKKIKEDEEELKFLQGINIDEATKQDAELHAMFIDFQCGNIERLRYEIDSLMQFINDYLRPG